MKEFIYAVFNLLEYTVRALLLLKIFKAWLPFRKSFERTGKYILCVQCVATQYLLSETRFLRRILYGENMMVDRSIKSAIIVILCAAVTFCFSMWLFEGKKTVKGYLTANFYALLELCRFLWYSLCIPLLSQSASLISRRIMEEAASLEKVDLWLGMAEVMWNFLMGAGNCILLYLVIRWYCRTLEDIEKKYSSAELLFLAFPSITGFVFCIFLRGILYSQRETEIRFLFEDYPGTRILVLVLTFLLVGLILVSIKAFTELIKRHEEKSRLIVYENQIEEMAQHVRDIENLYDGIRGMRHDMKNNIYAIKILLKEDPQEKNRETRREAQKYLMQMEESLDGMDYPVHSGNPVTDVVLGRIYRECRKEEITFTCDFCFPGKEEFPVFDICILLNNALDNAVEACTGLTEKEAERKRISLRSYKKRNLFFIEVKNGFDGKLLKDDNGNFLTTKKNEGIHGIGIQNMKKCVEKYFGRIEFSVDREYFTTQIMLQERKEKRNE